MIEIKTKLIFNGNTRDRFDYDYCDCATEYEVEAYTLDELLEAVARKHVEQPAQQWSVDQQDYIIHDGREFCGQRYYTPGKFAGFLEDVEASPLYIRLKRQAVEAKRKEAEAERAQMEAREKAARRETFLKLREEFKDEKHPPKTRTVLRFEGLSYRHEQLVAEAENLEELICKVAELILNCDLVNCVLFKMTYVKPDDSPEIVHEQIDVSEHHPNFEHAVRNSSEYQVLRALRDLEGG